MDPCQVLSLDLIAFIFKLIILKAKAFYTLCIHFFFWKLVLLRPYLDTSVFLVELLLNSLLSEIFSKEMNFIESYNLYPGASFLP